MNNPADYYLARLVALDEALAGGGPLPADGSDDPRWRESAAVLDLLHRANPRRGHPAAVGRFVVEGVVGAGASGVVYAATDPRFGRRVAVKVLTQTDALAVARFRVEVTAIAAVSHPHVVQVFELGEHEGRPFLVMELVPGGALGNAAPGGDRPERNAARLVAHVARGVGAVHAAGIVHRDLKPGNILLTPGGVPKVADFGLARRLDRPDPLTEVGASVGTPNYMSPEQAAGRGAEVGVASDVYSLGAILFFLVTGRHPFVGILGFDLLRRIVTEPPPRPRALNPAVPRPLERICLRCLEKNPADRYPSADALADDLDAFLAGGRVRADSRRKGRWRRRAGGLIAGVVVATAAVGVLGRSRPVAPPAAAPVSKGAVVEVGDVIGRHDGVIRALTLSPDGRRAVTFTFKGAGRVWDVAGRRAEADLPGTDGSAPAAFFPSGDRVVAVFSPNRLGVWGIPRGSLVAERQLPEVVNALAVRPDGLVAALDRTGVVHLWRPAADAYRRSPGFPFPAVMAAGLAFRAGHDELLTAHQHAEALGVWAFRGDGVRVIPNVGVTMPHPLAALPDGRVVVSTGSRVLVVTPTDPPAVRVLPVRDGVGPRSIAVANAGAWLIGACLDGTIRAWDVESGAELARADAPGVRAVSTTADGTWGVVGFADGTLRELRLGLSPAE